MYHPQRTSRLFALLLASLLAFNACTDGSAVAPTAATENYMAPMSSSSVTYLVSDVPDQYPGARPDPMLRNAWGMAMTPNGWFWVTATGSGHALVYDQFGSPVHPPVMIPNRAGDKGAAAPIGVIANASQYFSVPGMGPAQVIFASADGSISAWVGGESASLVATSAGDASYTGIAMLTNPRGEAYLYAADFAGGKIDVYDQNFAPVPMPFNGPVQEGYAPFNVVAIDRMLYVAYAKKGLDGRAEHGPGTGFINVYSMRGMFVRRLATAVELNAPWGMTAVKGTYGPYETLYVANFGDGTISTYNADGAFMGQMHNADGSLMKIDGLWGIMVPQPGSSPGIDPSTIWFAAGPQNELHGTFGYIRR